MTNIKISKLDVKMYCEPDACEYIPHAFKISRIICRVHNATELKAKEIGKLANGLCVAKNQARLNKLQGEVPSNGETLKLLGKIVTAANRLSEIEKSNNPPALRAKRLLDAQHIVNENGDSISIKGWLRSAENITVAAKDACDDLLNNIIENNESILELLSNDTPWEWSTELMGNTLQELYIEIYPTGTRGGNQGEDNNLKGQLFTFTRLAMRKLGYGYYSANAIKKAYLRTGFYKD